MGERPLIRLAFDLLERAQRTASRVDNALSEAVLALYDPAIERHASDRHYGASSTYTANLQRGLFPFELRAVKEHFPAPPASVLVPGMGGGREVVALLELGYGVHGFDPVDGYVQAARTATDRWPGTRLETLSLQDWIQQATGSYDAILAGWGMWAHVVRQADRLEALRAFRRVCPRGPLLLSFFLGDRVFDHEEKTRVLEPLHPEPEGRIARLFRKRVREQLLRREPVERGTGFRNGIFFHSTTEPELEDEARAAGWRVAYFEHDAVKFPHAVLI